MDNVKARFDADDAVWRFEVAGPAEPTVADALVAVTLPGLRWVVPVLRCAEPHEVEVGASPSPWAREAVRTLLGEEAAQLLDGPASGDEAVLEVAVDASLDAASRRAALGMVAVSLAGRPRGPLQALDVAALLQRAGLASPALLPPGAADLADDAVEALDIVPQVALDALASTDEPDRNVGWTVARAGVADARRFVLAAGEVPLDLDVDQEFEALVADMAADLLADAAAGDGRPLKMGGELGPRFRGGVPPRALPVYVVDPAIRGLTGRTASYDAASGVVRVVVSIRGLALHPAAPQIVARVIAEESREVIASQALEVDATQVGGPRLVARFELAADARPARVELVVDPRQPVVDLAGSRRLDACYLQGEAISNLVQLGCLQNDEVQDHIDLRERLAAELLRDRFADVLDGRDLDVFPLPSSGLLAVLGDLSEPIVAALRAVENPAERAAQAHNLALMVTEALATWGQGLAGDVAMIEAEARFEADGYLSLYAMNAVKRAEGAFHLAGRPEDVARSRRWLDQHGEAGA